MKVMLQEFKVPGSTDTSSPTNSCQLPLAVPQPCEAAIKAAHAAAPPEGTKVPLKGATPELMVVEAVGVKVVLV